MHRSLEASDHEFKLIIIGDSGEFMAIEAKARYGEDIFRCW